ncbi:MAG: chemotaxis protein [Shewanella sp.]
MQISSGLQGLQTAQSGLTQATIDVAKARSAPSPAYPDPTALGSNQVSTQTSADSTGALIAADVALGQGEAAARVVEVGSETLGTIIDINV